METLRSLREQVLDWLDESGDTGTTKKLVDHAINKSHANRLTMVQWPFMKYGRGNLTLVPGKVEYALHQEFLRPYYFRNISKGGIYLVEVPQRELSQVGIDWTKDQDGRHFEWGGRWQVERQPAAASVLTIVSSSTGDVGTTKKITVMGETPDGITSEDISPNGQNPVAGLVQFTKILGITKASAWAGTLTITADAGATTVLKLFGNEFGRNYQVIRLLFTPTTADVVEYDFFRKPRKLSLDYDSPDTPYPYSLIHVWDALLDISAYDGRIDGGRKALWERNQGELEIQMRNEFLEGRTIAARTRRVRDVIGDYDE